jgi:hypothetical protein
MAINTVEAIDTAIGNEESPWHEYNFDRAVRSFAEFSPELWDVLAGIAHTRPAFWQERCAEVMGENGSEHAIRILLELLHSPHIRVASIVVSELDNLEVVLSRQELPVLLSISEHLEAELSPRRADVKRLIAKLGA